MNCKKERKLPFLLQVPQINKEGSALEMYGGATAANEIDFTLLGNLLEGIG